MVSASQKNGGKGKRAKSLVNDVSSEGIMYVIMCIVDTFMRTQAHSKGSFLLPIGSVDEGAGI